MRGPLRPPSTFPMDPTPFVFHHTPLDKHWISGSHFVKFLKPNPVKSSRSARSAHSIKSLYSVNETFFFGAKMAWNHVFWSMGKMEFPPETSVVSHTIAFQAILAKKKIKKKESIECFQSSTGAVPDETAK